MFQEAIKMAWQYKSGNNDFMAEVMELLDDVRAVPCRAHVHHSRLRLPCMRHAVAHVRAWGPCDLSQDTLGAVDDGVTAKAAAAAPAPDGGDAPGAGSGAASGATAE